MTTFFGITPLHYIHPRIALSQKYYIIYLYVQLIFKEKDSGH